MSLKEYSLESFDNESNLLSIDRDCYLSMIQFMHTKTLRYYIGLSEETFLRIKHSFYHMYRRKFNEIPIRKLLRVPIDPKLEFHGRTVIGFNGLRTITLKDPIFETIFELRLKYTNAVWIQVKQENPNFNSGYRNYNTGLRFYSGYNKKFVCFHGGACFFGETIDITEYCLENNILTVILDMRSSENKLYFKVNGVIIKRAVNNRPHVSKIIQFTILDGESIDFISISYLKQLPKDICKGNIITFY
jgi:hypothetical protein